MKFACRLAVAVVVLAAGCTSVERAPPAEPSAAIAPGVDSAVEPVAVPAPPEGVAPGGAIAAAPAPVPPAVAPTPEPAAAMVSGAAGGVPPTAKPVVKPPPVIAPAPKPSAATSVPAPAVAKAPPLDLKTLEIRLKATDKIGVFSKLALKNQVDDLIDQFRAYYGGKLRVSLAELRQRFDSLVLKVLALLQDADPPLAQAIASSREAIWGILADPVKFAAV
jgi:hypothetical protein